ncbi:MAG: putative orf [Candidatus Scalindua rubra]|uniref:Putative orf n=1 Tax=Candidatus Scalindua rubra TaxID=1872076 RepID=A0A1E3X5X7_9BACT|nr:MAG: putative orf [Candidatus Scalindua rubra]
MFNSKSIKPTKYARVFLGPSNSTHRQYEALRGYFVEGLPSAEVASRFGYTPGSFRLLCHQFRQNPNRQFFLPPKKGPQTSPKKSQAREQVITMRKQNFSIYDIKRGLEESGASLSTVSISIILKEEGFARLTRRRDDERPNRVRPDIADVADVRKLQLQPRKFRTQFGGIFLFLPYLAKIPLDNILQEAGFPGSKMIPAGHAMRSLLALKLFGNARHSHVMSFVFDEGLPLFAGLNVIPKRAFLTEYSCRIHPLSYPKAMQLWFDAIGKLGIERGVSFDLDFHTIPFHGEDALVEKHYVSKRSRRQKGILAFLARDADKHIFCYANSQLRKDQQNDEILRFIEFWKKRTDRFPEELIFDSKLTTYSNLNRLNQMGIKFITLRRRSRKMLEKIYRTPVSAWRRIELDNIARAYRTPRILEQKISLDEYEGLIRQLTIMDLGHEEPTILITNQLNRSAAKLLGRYAKRMIIENAIADGIDFFHMDALSSAVAMKVDCDLQLTLMACSLYRLLGSQIGNGYSTAKSRHIFRDFINATAQISIEKKEIFVRFQKRAHNPLLKAAGFDKFDIPIPWLGNKRLRLIFG